MPRKPRYRHPAGEPLSLCWDETPDEWYCHGHVDKATWLDACLWMVSEHFYVNGIDNAVEHEDIEETQEVSPDPRDWVMRHVWGRWEIHPGSSDNDPYDLPYHRTFIELPEQERGAFPVTCGTPVDWLVDEQNDRIDRELKDITEARLLADLFPGAEVRLKPWPEARYPGFHGWVRVEKTHYGERYVRDGHHYMAGILKADLGYWIQADGDIDSNAGGRA